MITRQVVHIALLCILLGCASRPPENQVPTYIPIVNPPTEEEKVVVASAYAFVGSSASDLGAEGSLEYLKAQTRALDGVGKTYWETKDRGMRGSIGSSPAQSRDGAACRSYQSVIWVIGKGQLVTGTACRVDMGPWYAVRD